MYKGHQQCLKEINNFLKEINKVGGRGEGGGMVDITSTSDLYYDIKHFEITCKKFNSKTPQR